MSDENVQKLQLVQNHAARPVKKASKASSASLLHWLPIRKCFLYKIAIITVFMMRNHLNTLGILKMYTDLPDLPQGTC